MSNQTNLSAGSIYIVTERNCLCFCFETIYLFFFLSFFDIDTKSELKFTHNNDKISWTCVAKLGQNHACSWPGSLHHQNIIKHHTDPASDFAGPTQEVFRLHYFLKYWKLSRYQRFLIAPWGIWMKYFQTNVIDWWLLWNCNQVNVAGTCWWYVNIRLDNGLVLSGNKPLLEPILIQI